MANKFDTISHNTLHSVYGFGQMPRHSNGLQYMHRELDNFILITDSALALYCRKAHAKINRTITIIKYNNIRIYALHTSDINHTTFHNA